MPGEFARAARQGFGLAFGAMIAVIMVVCVLILLGVLFDLAV